jgi:cholesterol transport system auxiliary component
MKTELCGSREHPIVAGGGIRVRSKHRAAAAAALLLFLPGCALLGGGSKPVDTFDLSAPQAATGRREHRLQVLIANPTAIKAFDSQNIVIEPKPGRIEYLKGAQWADRLPEVVQARLAETFQKSGRFGGVGQPGEGLAIDYQVIADIRSFDIRVDGGERADVELYIRVLNDRNGVVRAERLFEATAPVSGSGNDAYIRALDRAFGQVAVDILDWSAKVM